MFLFVNIVVRVYVCIVKRNLFDELWFVFIFDVVVILNNLCRIVICLNIIIFVSIKI